MQGAKSMIYSHVKPKYIDKSLSESTNIQQGTNVNDIELTLMALSSIIEKRIEAGKKGVKLGGENKASYKKLRKMLYALNDYFSYKGCFSFGICATCENFKNSGTSNGTFGYCKNNPDRFRHAFDTCEEYKGNGGFGLNE